MADIRTLGHGRFLIRDGSVQRPAYAVRNGEEVWVFVQGDVFVVGQRGAVRARGRTDEQSLAAPMPATVVSIEVAVGDQVEAGHALVVLEAMKMELAITAPHAGRITRIACRQGEIVEPGVPLVEIA